MINIKGMLIKYQDVFFPVFDVLLNGLNFFMHIYISWFISLNEYSILNAMLSFLAILFVVGISVQTYTNKEVGKSKNNSQVIRSIFSLLISIGLFLNILLLLLFPTLIKIMRTDTLGIILIMLIFDMNIILSFYRGIMQSQQHFLSLNINFYVEVITKLIVIVAILPFFSQPHIPLIGILLGMFFSLIHGYHSSGRLVYFPMLFSKKIRVNLFGLAHIIWANFFLYYLTSVSLIVANYYIGERAALYAVSLKFSQLIMAVGFSVITVVVSYSSGLIIHPEEFKAYVHKWLIRFCLGGVVILVGYQLVVRHFIAFLFGEAYQGASQFMVFQALGYVMLTIAYFMISELIIMNQKVHIYILAAVSAMLTAGILLYHESIRMIIVVEVVSYSLLLVTLFMIYMRREKKDAAKV